MDILHISSVQSPTDGHLGCLYILSFMNNAALKVCVQVFVWTYVFISLRYYYELNCIFPPKNILKVNSSTSECDLTWKWVFIEAIMLKWGHWVRLQSNILGVLINRKIWTRCRDTQGETQMKTEGCIDASTNQGMLRISGKHQKLQEARQDSLYSHQGEQDPANTLI